MGRVTHFEVHADDPERAMEFYRRLLGWSFQRWGGIDYWLTETGPDDVPGINGAIMRRSAPADGQGAAARVAAGATVGAYVCTAAVDDLAEALTRVAELGGSVDGPKRAVPGVGWHAYVRDSEGNLLGLMQEDSEAA